MKPLPTFAPTSVIKHAEELAAVRWRRACVFDVGGFDFQRTKLDFSVANNGDKIFLRET
jgi:hypothetical protein